MAAAGIPLGAILDDSGYAHRDADAWAIPLRQAGAQLIQDLHPSDRGPKGTHHGAIIANGNLYCPATPKPLLQLGPLAPAATPDETTAHDQQTAELARHKLGPVSADDADGYHRVMCPAVAGKIRCPLRPASMKLDRRRPAILAPPQHPPAWHHPRTTTRPPRPPGPPPNPPQRPRGHTPLPRPGPAAKAAAQPPNPSADASPATPPAPPRRVPRALARPGRSARALATRHAQDHLSPPGTCAPGSRECQTQT